MHERRGGSAHGDVNLRHDPGHVAQIVGKCGERRGGERQPYRGCGDEAAREQERKASGPRPIVEADQNARQREERRLDGDR